MGKNRLEAFSDGVIAIIITIMVLEIKAPHGDEFSALKDWKGKLSIVLYAPGIATSFWLPALSQGIYVFVALMWLIPDKQIEQAIP